MTGHCPVITKFINTKVKSINLIFKFLRYNLLECSSKLPVYELSKYPSIVLNLTTTKKTDFTAIISAENYVYSCWYDV